MSPFFQVLIVEDDSGTRTLFRAVLERSGLTVTAVCDGDEALELLGDQRFDAIVLDLRMGGTDGAGVLQQLMSRTPETLQRVVVATAASARDLRRIPELEHVAAVLRKPLDIDELTGEVNACVAASVVERNMGAASFGRRPSN